jgi:hypothetical protein
VPCTVDGHASPRRLPSVRTQPCHDPHESLRSGPLVVSRLRAYVGCTRYSPFNGPGQSARRRELTSRSVAYRFPSPCLPSPRSWPSGGDLPSATTHLLRADVVTINPIKAETFYTIAPSNFPEPAYVTTSLVVPASSKPP